MNSHNNKFSFSMFLYLRTMKISKYRGSPSKNMMKMDSLSLKNISIKSSLPLAIKVLLMSLITSLTNQHQSTTLISSPAKSKATWRKSKMPLTSKVRKVCMKNWRMIFSQSWLNPKLKPTRRKRSQRSQSQRKYLKLSSHWRSKCLKQSFPNSCNNLPHQS